MANVHNIISLGIGSPASIPHFLTLGLFDGSLVTFAHACERTLTCTTPRRTMTSTTPERTMVSTTPRRTIDCLED